MNDKSAQTGQALDMKSTDITSLNIEKIAVFFPNCVTETAEGKKIDFALLKQELSTEIVEGNKERYRLEWPGKREAIVTANLPTTKTLRPVREDSVDFDTTENLYIEGDNLEVLKLLQESYLGKIKMIYIDPPYNTGKDFVYKDNFAKAGEEELIESGQKDEYNQKLVANPETSGRYHSDWLSMMYPRLKLARNLLTEDGVIFISIDDNEVHNLRKICDEVFGEGNFVAELSVINNLKGNNDQFGFAGTHEYNLVYSKNYSLVSLYEIYMNENEIESWEEDEFGLFKKGANLKATGINAPREKRPNLFFPIYIDENLKYSLIEIPNANVIYPITNGKEMSWRWSKEKFNNEKHNVIISENSGEFSIYKKQRNNDDENPTKKPKSTFLKPEYSSGNGSTMMKFIFENKVFDFPKSLELIKDFVTIGSRNNDIILDFFSGSATTAHAVMQLNAEDGGNRKYIMVQLPEATDEKSEAYKAGYKNICEIGKERIRRAAQKIKAEKEEKAQKEGLFAGNYKDVQDYGFRVYRLDSSNMQEVYYKPQDYNQATLDLFADNVKPGRTAEDLLTQIMLDWGLPLSLKIERKTIAGKEVFSVAGDSLYACFDHELDETFAKEIAKEKPLRIVFRDNGFKDDTAKENVRQLLKQLSPQTEMRVV